MRLVSLHFESQSCQSPLPTDRLKAPNYLHCTGGKRDSTDRLTDDFFKLGHVIVERSCDQTGASISIQPQSLVPSPLTSARSLYLRCSSIVLSPSRFKSPDVPSLCKQALDILFPRGCSIPPGLPFPTSIVNHHDEVLRYRFALRSIHARLRSTQRLPTRRPTRHSCRLHHAQLPRRPNNMSCPFDRQHCHLQHRLRCEEHERSPSTSISS
ncbi:hypothetical protein K491DRAFT_393191 [Lophiostoma macrostomum CBS 122681]|uniref:Uncharacterized protein n=1 Tax=Lophiostoma macrostomum CBS 122681 TaxID=1314788 RepID=A0A6A6T9F4_9PLEO|nr:hypothetical protein K491DRAFT_393191 [Lophiostoma macrostomum CBS 122681]